MCTNNFSSMLFRKTVALLILLSFSAISSAEIFKCVDKVTGKLAFTDQACPNDQSGDYQPIGATNVDGGFNSSATHLARERREAEASALRQNWQTHNANELSKLDRERAIEEEQRARRENNRKVQREMEWRAREHGSSEGRRYQTTRPGRVTN